MPIISPLYLRGRNEPVMGQCVQSSQHNWVKFKTWEREQLEAWASEGPQPGPTAPASVVVSDPYWALGILSVNEVIGDTPQVCRV